MRTSSLRQQLIGSAGQNFGWHSDNATRIASCGTNFGLLHLADLLASVYDHKDFQDQTIVIWEHLARVCREIILNIVG